ncbi:MAG TPA: class I SAM-dependent methyltransferase, partial [Solirubrobacteraceae bacterium]
GCGPGRHVVALRARGVEALGVDASDVAARLARDRGAPVVHGSLFGPVPGVGTWRAGLLLDGNLGIGGDPVRLLDRAAELLAPEGELWVELSAPARERASPLRLRSAGRLSAPFPWASVGIADLGALVAFGPWRLAEHWTAAGRCFARLERRWSR